MKYLRGAVAAAFVVALAGSAAAQQDKPKQKKPSLTLKANPAITFAPARVVVVADAKGGSDDYEGFYCAAISWEWGDGTESENATDCDPYEAGRSEIQRHFSAGHRYDLPGEYRVVFRLKRGDKVVGSASTTVRVKPGLRDIGGAGVL